MLNNVKREIWSGLKWMWSIIVLTFFIGYAANIAQTPSKDFIQNFPNSTVGWFFFGPYNEVTYGLIIFLFLYTAFMGVLVLQEEHYGGGKALNKYLQDVINEHQDLRPVGFAQQSALISVSVPLKDIFIRLHAIIDRPRFDLPTEQIKQLEEVRQRSDISPEKREEQIQALRIVWYSQLGREWTEAQEPQQVAIESVLSQLISDQPAAVILGHPGSGKSTTMRWFAFQMASAWRLSTYRHSLNKAFTWLSKIIHRPLPWSYQLPEGLAPPQIPILLHISEYAEQLSHAATGQIPFEQFLFDQLRAKYAHLPKLAEKLHHQLQHGHCLLLVDGLDEVANDELRRRVAKLIAKFVASYTSEVPTTRAYNRFIITSRIISYEASAFVKYAHYTLQDLKDEQILHFLQTWCPAVEYHQRAFGQGMQKLTIQQKMQVEREGLQQCSRLVDVLSSSPGIKRLAVNPLMLTILALIQRSGKTLPQRRIELYQIVVRTLLDNWNHDKGRRIFPVEEIPLAEDLLMHLAYALHQGSSLMTESQVKKITRTVMQNFYKQIPSETAVTHLIDTLRRSSGIFVESGLGLFSFMHRTFQEYFVALFLRLLPKEELDQFIQDHILSANWQEPVQLLIAYKSGQDVEERPQASQLVQLIIDHGALHEHVLHRNLLFATVCIIDCNVWSIHPELQRTIANHLFDLYGDSLGSGRYTWLQQEIERIMRLWLLSQPQGSAQKETLPPLLQAWQTALCNPEPLYRQNGAIHIFTSIAPDLELHPSLVFTTLIPPIIHLAGLQDYPCPPEIRLQLTQLKASPGSKHIEDYAFVALRLLDKYGPAGWLYQQWIEWNNEQGDLLRRLNAHSLELGYFLTPIAFPLRVENSIWGQQIEIGQLWKYRRKDFNFLQTQLFQIAQTARYPYAYLLKKMLDQEQTLLHEKKEFLWRDVWDKFLKEEMQRGHGATYQICLNLRLLLHEHDTQKLQQIAIEIKESLLVPGNQQIRAILVICNIYLRYIEYTHDLRYIRFLKDVQYLRDLLDLRYVRYLRDLPDLLDLITLLDQLDLPYLVELQNQLNLSHLLDLLYLLDLRHLRDTENFRDIRSLRDALPLRLLTTYISQEDLITDLCDLLQKENTISSFILLGIYSVISTYEIIPDAIERQVEQSIAYFSSKGLSRSEDAKILIEVLKRLKHSSSPSEENIDQKTIEEPNERVNQLLMWKQGNELTSSQVKDLLIACTDTHTLPEKVWEEFTGGRRTFRIGTIGEIAWNLLQEVKVSNDAFSAVLQSLESENAIICGGAALLLRKQPYMTATIRQEVTMIILRILEDHNASCRLLEPPGYSRIWRLDDLLFETLNFIST